MKVLLINKYHYNRGGSESVYFNTAELLQRHGHKVVFFATRHPKNFSCEQEGYFAYAPELRDLSVIGKIKGIGRFFRNRDAERQLERLILAEKPDIAHVHNFFNGLGLGILKVLHKHGVPVVVSLHDARFICPSVRLMNDPDRCRRCQRFGYLGCLAHKCYEDSLPLSAITMMEMMHKEWLFPYDRYINRYIFLSKRFQYLFSERHEWFGRKGTLLYNFNASPHYTVPHRGDYMLFYARICREKGVLTLLDTARRMPDVKFVMAGTGPLYDEIKVQKPANLEMPGFVCGQPLEDLIKGAEYVIVPSEWEENNPMTVIEAYGYAKPVISSDRGGIPEIVPDGKTGFIFPQKDADALVQTIQQAVNLTDTEYQQMAENALQFARDNFDAGAYYPRLLKIYQDVINSRTR